MANSNLVELTSVLVSAYLRNHEVPSRDLPNVVNLVFDALKNAGSAPQPQEIRPPAVPIRRSIQPDYIICLEDGKKLKTLKRYLMTNFRMTPDDYRAKWRLPQDYPMVAPNYTVRRSQLAKESGLGRRGR